MMNLPYSYCGHCVAAFWEVCLDWPWGYGICLLLMMGRGTVWVWLLQVQWYVAVCWGCSAVQC